MCEIMINTRRNRCQEDLNSFPSTAQKAQNRPLWRLMSTFGTTHS